MMQNRILVKTRAELVKALDEEFYDVHFVRSIKDAKTPADIAISKCTAKYVRDSRLMENVPTDVPIWTAKFPLSSENTDSLRQYCDKTFENVIVW